MGGAPLRTARLEDMKGGWFVPAFDPTVLPTGAAEVAVKHYPAGAYEKRHLHKIATAVTVITAGGVAMHRLRYRTCDPRNWIASSCRSKKSPRVRPAPCCWPRNILTPMTRS